MPDHAQCRICQKQSTEFPDLKFLRDQDSETVLCIDCIKFFHDTVTGKHSDTTSETFNNILPDPKFIYSLLDSHIINQEDAKKQVSISIAQHFRRLQDGSIDKSNLLIIGPTGTGKSEMARVISKELNLDFLETKITNITSRGYAGEDIESLIQDLFQACDYNKERAERGIIFIDEIDKIAKDESMNSSVSNKAVQQELLKIIEGTQVKVRKGNKNSGEEFFINTKNILFICAGAFEGLKVKTNKKSIGFITQEVEEDLNTKITTEDLVSFGLIPELLGRLPIITETLPLTEEDLHKILTTPKNSLIHQYQKLFKMDHIFLEVCPEYLKEISKEAFSKNLGARGLRQIFESKTKDLFFNLDQYKNKKIILGKEISVINLNKTEISKI